MVTLEDLANHATDAMAYLRDVADTNGLPDIYGLDVQLDDETSVSTVRVLLKPHGLDEIGRIDGIRAWANYLGGEVHLSESYESSGRMVRGLDATACTGAAKVAIWTFLTMADAAPVVLSHAA
jgi:hypothetical protein